MLQGTQVWSDDNAVIMHGLLGQINRILATTLPTPLKLDPVTNEEIMVVEQKFQIDFPPGRPWLMPSMVCDVCHFSHCVLCCVVSELREFFKWNNGVPGDTPGMSKFVQCASLAEIYEVFFHKFNFARMMHW